MAASLENKDGGSVALYINGDLQFDSADERIYHESLALPALALASKRTQSQLNVLIIGGGDGLVAREMFKSPQVRSLTLVDYDPEILTFAKNDLAFLNEGSLSDPRIEIQIQDAWEYVDQALERNKLFDVIVSDLTVPENAMQARFHSIDWYAKLAGLLHPQGILAVNAVSPDATPQAYWSIFNSLQASRLHARPYHIELPSFTALGYGRDWGFFLASPEAITANEINSELPIAHPREFLSNSNLCELFLFPDELFEYQAKSLPACAGSDILIHYFNNSVRLDACSGKLRDALNLDTTNLVVPEADTGKHILPPELCSALADSIAAGEHCNSAQPGGVQLFLHEVLNLMPSLQRDQTSELITEFLEEPAAFLKAIDLPELITRLIRRGAELPSQLVAELKLLQDSLVDWADDHETLLSLGNRVITVLVLAIVVGNLLYPDAVYAKGHGYAHRGGAYGNSWGGTTYYNNNYRRRVIPRGPIGPGPNAAAERDMRKMSLPQRNDVSDAEYTDENGSTYPRRQYRTAQVESQMKSVYRLGPGTDVLADGTLAMPLTDRSYLLLTPGATKVIEQKEGHCVMSLQNDPALLQAMTSEISRQLAKFGSSKSSSPASSKDAVLYLSKADELFKHSDQSEASNTRLEGLEVFPSACLTEDGQYLMLRREGGEVVYLDGKNWYRDVSKSALGEEYPENFRSIVVAYLSKIVSDFAATQNRLLADKLELTAQMDMIASELQAYKASSESTVLFGTRNVSRGEAIRLSELASHKIALQIQLLNNHIEELPGNIELIKIGLANITTNGQADDA